MNNSIIPKLSLKTKRRKKLDVISSQDTFKGLKAKLERNFSATKLRRNSVLFRKKSADKIQGEAKHQNYLWTVFFVKKFADILKSNVWVQKLKKFKKFHFEVINDASYFTFEPVNQSLLLNNPLFASMVILFLKLEKRNSGQNDTHYCSL